MHWFYHSYLTRLLHTSQRIFMRSYILMDPLSTFALALRIFVQLLFSLSILLANTIGPMYDSSSYCLNITPSRYSHLVFLLRSISLFPSKTLKTHPLAAKLQPFKSSIPMEINFFTQIRNMPYLDQCQRPPICNAESDWSFANNPACCVIYHPCKSVIICWICRKYLYLHISSKYYLNPISNLIFYLSILLGEHHSSYLI